LNKIFVHIHWSIELCGHCLQNKVPLMMRLSSTVPIRKSYFSLATK